MRRKERLEEKSLQARRMDDIFEVFRNNIESILNPWWVIIISLAFSL